MMSASAATLHEAVLKGDDIACMKVLAAAPLLVRATDDRGLLPLHVSAMRGLAALCLALLEHGAEVDAPTQLVPTTRRAAEDGWARTALTFAAEYGHNATISLLLREGASASSRTTLGKTPLHFAAEYGHAAAIALILEASGASADETARAVDCSSASPLAYAVRGGHESAVQALLSAAPRTRDGEDVYGCTALSWALEYPLHGRDSHRMADRGEQARQCVSAAVGRQPAGGRAVDTARGRSRGRDSIDAAREVCRALLPWALPQPSATQVLAVFNETSPVNMAKWSPVVWTPLLAFIVSNPGLNGVWSGNSDELEQLAKTVARVERVSSPCAEPGSERHIAEGSFFHSAAAQSVRAARSALDSMVGSLFRSVNVGTVFEVRMVCLREVQWRQFCSRDNDWFGQVAAAERQAGGGADAGAYGEVVPHDFLRYCSSWLLFPIDSSRQRANERCETYQLVCGPNRLLFRTYTAHCQPHILPEPAIDGTAGTTDDSRGGHHHHAPTNDWNWGTFVDVGSGSGIGVFTANLALPFSVCAVRRKI